MKYEVSRASQLYSHVKTQPCQEAYLNDSKTSWCIDINSLEELQKFVEDHDKIIMYGNSIMIYDDYVE